MAPKKKDAAKAPEAPKPTAAAKAKDAEEKPAIYRADLGEALPPQAPLPAHNPNRAK